MSLLESLSDPNRHSKQPNSFAAVQTTWNKSGTKAPKPQTSSESKATVAADSSGKKSSHEFQKEISRLDKKITKVATTVGTLYNKINLLIEKQNSSGASNGRQTVDAGRNSLQTDKTGSPPSIELQNFVTALEKIVNKNSERQSSEAYAWRDVSFFMMGVTSMCLLSSAFLVYNLKQKNT